MARPEFHRLADRELNEAAQYYEVEEPGLGSSFLQEVERGLESIEAHPRSRYDPARFRAPSPSSPIPLRALVQDQAQRHPDPRGDESQAAAFILGWPRVKSQQPNFRFQPTGYAGG